MTPVSPLLGDTEEVVLFRTPTGRAVHIQHDVAYIDIMGETVIPEESPDTPSFSVAWLFYERRRSICGKLSASGMSSPDRGASGWCADEDLCRTCMNALDDAGRQLVFEYLTANEPPLYEEELPGLKRGRQ
jgi:hypothetical protein